MDSGLLGIGVFLLILSLFTFGLRVYVRAVLIQQWGLDDWFMTAAVVAYFAYCVCQFVGVVYGIGQHMEALEPNRSQKALMLWWLGELFYIPATVLAKLSIGVLLHRLAIEVWHTRLIRFVMWSTGVFGVVYFLLAIFQCVPISAWWLRKNDPLSSKSYGWCFNTRTVVGVTFTSCALNATADCTFGILPIIMVKDLRMPKQQKYLASALLGFANIACVATIIRTPYAIRFYGENDFLYETRPFAWLSTIEPGIGIAAGCAATLRPLLRQLIDGSAFGSSGNVLHSMDDESGSNTAGMVPPRCAPQTLENLKLHSTSVIQGVDNEPHVSVL